MELKSGEGTVVVADRDRCCNDGCNGRNSGWGSGWGAVGDALVGGGFGAAAVSVWDTKPIPISGILVTKWEQASIVLWTVFARWNMNNRIAAAKLKV